MFEQAIWNESYYKGCPIISDDKVLMIFFMLFLGVKSGNAWIIVQMSISEEKGGCFFLNNLWYMWDKPLWLSVLRRRDKNALNHILQKFFTSRPFWEPQRILTYLTSFELLIEVLRNYARLQCLDLIVQELQIFYLKL